MDTTCHAHDLQWEEEGLNSSHMLASSRHQYSPTFGTSSIPPLIIQTMPPCPAQGLVVVAALLLHLGVDLLPLELLDVMLCVLFCDHNDDRLSRLRVFGLGQQRATSHSHMYHQEYKKAW